MFALLKTSVPHCHKSSSFPNGLSELFIYVLPRSMSQNIYPSTFLSRDDLPHLRYPCSSPVDKCSCCLHSDSLTSNCCMASLLPLDRLPVLRRSKHINTIQCNAMQCNAMQCNAMQCNAMQCNAIHHRLFPT